MRKLKIGKLDGVGWWVGDWMDWHYYLWHDNKWHIGARDKRRKGNPFRQGFWKTQRGALNAVKRWERTHP